jgi:hypothetical protein
LTYPNSPLNDISHGLPLEPPVKLQGRPIVLAMPVQLNSEPVQYCADPIFAGDFPGKRSH